MKIAAYADAGSLWNFTGPTTFPATGEVISGSICPTFGPAIPNAVPCPIDNAMHIRSSVGVGLIWESPFGIRLCIPAHEGTLRPDPAVPLRRGYEILSAPAAPPLAAA